MIDPAALWLGEIGGQIGPVEDVTRSRCVDNFSCWHGQGGQARDLAALVIPEAAMFALCHAADFAAARFEIVEHGLGREIHLLAETLGNKGRIDKAQKLMRVGAQAPAIQRGQNAFFAAGLGIVNGGVGLVAIKMQGADTCEVKTWHAIEIIIIARAKYRALAMMGHDEREG